MATCDPVAGVACWCAELVRTSSFLTSAGSLALQAHIARFFQYINNTFPHP